MNNLPKVQHLSIYFFAGDFVEAYRRFEVGESQVYATHDEVCRLFDDLAEAGIKVSVYSFMTEKQSVDRINPYLEVTSLGAKRWDDEAPLKKAIQADRSDVIIPHFGNLALLRGAIRSKARTAAFTAGSYNRGTLREYLTRARIVRLYNHKAFDFVANHCLPSTLKLLEYGVKPSKLLAWDIPHQYSPADFAVKGQPSDNRFQIAYAGTISEAKGVGDLIRAVAQVNARGEVVTAKIAGAGETREMADLAAHLGVADRIDFLGVIPNSEVISLFRTSDAVCVPSRPEFPEGFPLTMFEAIASRTPIVCSDHPMFRFVMKSAETACVFRAKDIGDFADKIEVLVKDEALYGSLSRNADIAWKQLSRSADWRTLIVKWVTSGVEDPWIQERVMTNTELEFAP